MIKFGVSPIFAKKHGYRYYGDKELERLQQIPFYRELDFTLEKIKIAMQNERSHLRFLCDQKTLLMARQQRCSSILHTLEEAIICTEKGVTIAMTTMPIGFASIAALSNYCAAAATLAAAADARVAAFCPMVAAVDDIYRAN